MKQVKFLDKENNEIHGGILTDDGQLICACCGSLFEADEINKNGEPIEILQVYDTWIDFSEFIIE